MNRSAPILATLALVVSLSLVSANAADKQLMIESYTSNGDVQLFDGSGKKKAVAAIQELPQPTAVLDQARGGKLLRIDYQDDDTWVRSLNANLSRTATVDSDIECKVEQRHSPTAGAKDINMKSTRGLGDC